MEEKQESGVTFGEIFGALKKRIWVVLIVTFTIAFVAVLAVQFLYNPYGSTYSLTFTLSYPDANAGKYPDGSPFYYQDIISAESLQETKESDGRFSGIDVEKLSGKDGVAILAEQPVAGEAAQAVTKYTVTVKAGYFSGKRVATEFLNALARRPIMRAVEIAKEMNYTLDEAPFTNADFEGKLELLAQQRENILEQYDTWIAFYRGGYSVAGKTLVNHRAEIDVIFGEVLQESLFSELETNGYVSLGLVEAQRSALEAEKAENERKIEALKSALQWTSPAALTADNPTVIEQQPLDLSEMLASLLVRNVQIESQLSVLTEENITAFEERLNGIYADLQKAAQKVQAVGIALYEQESRVYFNTAQAVQEGDINLILAAVGGVVLGFLIAAFAVCIAEIPKSKKANASDRADGNGETEPADADQNAEENQE